MKHILLGLLCFMASCVFSQNALPTFQSNNSLSFSSFRSGVKMAFVAFDEKKTAQLINNPDSPEGQALHGIIQYLRDNGFEDVQWGAFSNKPDDVPSLCEISVVKPEWIYADNVFSDFQISYISCKNDVFTFASDKPIQVFSHTNVQTAFYKRLQLMYGYKKSKFTFDYCLVLESEMTPWKEEKLKTDLLEKGVDNMEGIYECLTPNSSGQKLRIGVVKSEDRIELVYLSGASNYLDWTDGELQAHLHPTATGTLFKCDWKNNDKTINSEPYLSFEQGMLNLIFSPASKQIFIKTFPSISDNLRTKNNNTLTGSGFAVTSDGLIVTNYHVIKGAKSIRVKGLGSDASIIYDAEVLIEDKNNDLAIIKIIDSDFSTVGDIPYGVSGRTGEVGSSVFVLGYPLPKSMGNEIKLTNGLISSKSGFQGDVTSYQISAPIQPGNSGGPVFDEFGNVVGIISAKHNNAEQASYAIKSSYLNNLFDLIPQQVSCSASNALAGKPLTEQVRRLKNFVCIVEVN